MTTQSDVDAITRIEDRITEILIDGDLQDLPQYYDESNVVGMPPNVPPLFEMTHMIGYLQGLLDAFQITHYAVNIEEVDVEGDLAFSRFKYRMSLLPHDAKEGESGISDEGSGITVWRRVNGDWKRIRAIWNSDLPMPTA